MPAQDEIACLGRQGGGLKDRPIVGLQHFQPGAEIVCMPNGGDDPKLGAQEGGTQLGDQLLASVCLASPLAGEIAVEPRHMAGPVRLMPTSA